MKRLVEHFPAFLQKTVLRRGATALTALFARSCQQITAFILIMLAASVLTPAEYGVYTLGIIFILFLQTLTYSGLFHYIVTAKGDDARILDTSFWLMMAISISGSVVLLAISPLVSILFRNPAVGQVVWWLAWPQPVSAAVAWASATFMRDKRMQAYYNIMILQNVGAMIGGVALLFLWKSVMALVAYRFLRSILGALLYLGHARRWPGLRADRSHAREAMSYASGLYGSRAVTFLSTYAADLLLGIFLSTAEAGIYRFGVRLATAGLDIVVQPLKNFALAHFGAATREGQPLGPMLLRFLSTALILLGCGASAIIVLAEPAIRAWFRVEYLPATAVAVAFAAKAVLGTGEMYVEPFLAAKGRTGLAMTFGGVATGGALLAVLASVPFGLSAIAWAQAVVTGLASLAGLVLMGRLERFNVMAGATKLVEVVVMVLAFALLLALVIQGATTISGSAGIALALSVAVGGALGLGVLVLAYRRKLFFLSVMSD